MFELGCVDEVVQTREAMRRAHEEREREQKAQQAARPKPRGR